MAEPLNTYIEDHLAGAQSAAELLGAMRDQHKGEPLGDFAARMLAEVEADRKILEQIAEQIGSSGNFKKLSAWMAEKLSRLKLSGGSTNPLGVFETLEFLGLGVQGKLALWRALTLVKGCDQRLRHVQFDQLITRAEAQFQLLEVERLRAAEIALCRS